jgi:hypothetical protein
MGRPHLWFFYISIIFVSMMALLMPGTPRNENVQGKVTLNWPGDQAIENGSLSDEIWMPNCLQLQRAAMRGATTDANPVKVSCKQ